MPLSKRYVMYFLHLLLGFAIVKDDLRSPFFCCLFLCFFFFNGYLAIKGMYCVFISLVFTFPFLKKSSNSVPQPNGNWADTGTPVQLGTGSHPAPWQPGMSVVWMDQLTVPRAAESGWGEMHSVFKKAKMKRPQSMVLVLARCNMYPGENLLYPVLWNHFFSSWRTLTR